MLYQRKPWVVALLFSPWLLIGSLFLADFHAFPNLPNMSEVLPVIVRTVLIAALTAVASVVIGLSFAWICQHVRQYTAEWLAVLLLPTLAGGLFWGFFGKTVILRFDFALHYISERSTIASASVMFILYIIQYATLASYVLLARARTIPHHNRMYAKTALLSPDEVARDIFWPHCRSLSYALVFLIFLLTATEYSTTSLAIHPSVGTANALMSHWLAEEYRDWLPVEPNKAAARIGVFGAASAAIILIFAFATTVMFIATIDQLAASRSKRKSGNTAHYNVSYYKYFGFGAAYLAIMCVISPFVASYMLFPPKPSTQTLSLLIAAIYALGVSIVCLSASSLIAILVKLWSPAAFRKRTHDIVFLYAIMLHPLALPPLVFGIATFWWFAFIEPLGYVTVLAAWVCGHVLHSMPLLVAFCFWTYSRIATGEIEYQSLVRIRFSELFKTSFWDRFGEDHLMLLLFAWTLAWNDAVINRAADPDILSLYMFLAPELSVRPDYRAAQWSLLMSVVIGIIIIILWRRIARRVAVEEYP